MKKPILFYIQSGHGQDNDPGATYKYPNGKVITERDIVFDICTNIYKKLLSIEDREFKVEFAEKEANEMHIYQHAHRILNLSKQFRVVTIDVHLNSFGASNPNGCEVWVGGSKLSTKRRLGTELGKYIIKELTDLGLYSRGIKIDPQLQSLKSKGIPVLIECGFISNSDDRSTFNTKVKRNILADKIVNALLKYERKYR